MNTIKGIVVHGEGMAGRQGMPSANVLILNPNFEDGVYLTSTIIDKQYHNSMTWIKIINHFARTETCIYDFNEVIYGAFLNIILWRRLGSHKELSPKLTYHSYYRR